MHNSSASNFPFTLQPSVSVPSLNKEEIQRNQMLTSYSLATPQVAAVHNTNSYLTSMATDRANRNLVTLHTDQQYTTQSPSFPSFHHIYNAVAANRSQFPTHNYHAAFQPNHFALTNAAGFHPQARLPNHNKTGSKPPEFLPLRRTQEPARELPATVAQEPLIIEDLDDYSGEFSKMCKYQEVQYKILQEDDRQTDSFCRKWC